MACVSVALAALLASALSDLSALSVLLDLDDVDVEEVVVSAMRLLMALLSDLPAAGGVGHGHGQVHGRCCRGVEPIRRSGQKTRQIGEYLIANDIRQHQRFRSPTPYGGKGLLIGVHLDGDGGSAAGGNRWHVNGTQLVGVGMGALFSAQF